MHITSIRKVAERYFADRSACNAILRDFDMAGGMRYNGFRTKQHREGMWMDGRKIRLGVMGPGAIFRRMMADLHKADGVELRAIASRDLGRARSAAEKYGAPLAFGSYEEMAASQEVDLVYIATPHNFHMEQAIMCMERGKHVLCEKPMALNDSQTAAMIDCARRNGVFLMEAMWTRFFPATVKMQELIAAGVIGKVWHVAADFCFSGEFDPESRMFAPELAGGALLDLGIYPMSAATLLLGHEPVQVHGTCAKAPSGVDGMDQVTMAYEGGATAHLLCGMSAVSAQTEVILGSEGRIEVPDFWHPTRVQVYNRSNQLVDEHVFAPENEGHWREFAHARECIIEGVWDSPVMPLEETLALSRIMTKLRRQWGVRYPQEQ